MILDYFVLGFGLSCFVLLVVILGAIVRATVEEHRHPWTGPRGRGFTEEFFNGHTKD